MRKKDLLEKLRASIAELPIELRSDFQLLIDMADEAIPDDAETASKPRKGSKKEDND